MKNNSFTEPLLAFLLILLAALCFQPLQTIWMPMMASSFVLVAFVAVFVSFAVFIWKEEARDERENQHRLTAGRNGFLVGAGLLVAGIILQTVRHELDSWLVVTLIGMVISKLATRWYTQAKG
jgi:heme/copper-type cytochrome/quinol oxidase subunit 2